MPAAALPVHVQLREITSALRAALPATVHTGLIRNDPSTLRPVMASHDIAATLDHLQSTFELSPIRTALNEQRPVAVSVEADHRWPALTNLVRDTGVRGILCLPLSGCDRRLGVLTLYAHLRSSFTPPDTTIAGIFAARAARVLTTAVCPTPRAVPTLPARMTITRLSRGSGPMTVALSGEIDACTAPALRVLLLHPAQDLVIDLSGVTFIGAAGLTALLELKVHLQRSGSTLRLTAVPRAVERLMFLVHLDGVLLTTH